MDWTARKRILLGRLLPAVALALAIFLGWLGHGDLPLGRLFATIIPAMGGRLPPALFGHGRMAGPPPVPDDMTPRPRPARETFLSLPGGG